MIDFLTVTVDKFTFRVATDRLYSPEGVWAKSEDDRRVRLGLSDFVQQLNGDVAFAEVRPIGTEISDGGEFAVIETIKANVELPSPVSGVVAEANPVLADRPETVNLDPYGEGWLAVLGKAILDRHSLLTPEAYLQVIKGRAESEVGKK